MPTDYVLWMVVQIPDAQDRPARYYLSRYPVMMMAHGRWKLAVRVGDPRDVDRPYWLHVYLLAKSQVRAVEQSAEEALVRLPPGFGIQLANQEVMRTAELGNC